MYKTFRSVTIGTVGIVCLSTILALFIMGAEWLTERLLPWFVFASFLAFAFLILVLLPLALFRQCRSFASASMLAVSFVLGTIVWIHGLLLTMTLCGAFGVIVGLFLGGIGVVPIAILAAISKGMWARLVELLALLVLTFSTRYFAVWVGGQAGAENVFSTVHCRHSPVHSRGTGQDLRTMCIDSHWP